MKAWRILRSALTPMDTSKCDAALDRFAATTKAKSIRARALRMDVNCGDAIEAVDRLARASANVLQASASNAGLMLRRAYMGVICEGLPADLKQQLKNLD